MSESNSEDCVRRIMFCGISNAWPRGGVRKGEIRSWGTWNLDSLMLGEMCEHLREHLISWLTSDDQRIIQAGSRCVGKWP